jgi:ubiquinone/menaquinone biosynthesis C-methylase UbiE
LKPYVKPGWTVLDIGPGIGYFTIPLARLVGVGGKVIAADLQLEMLEGINRRARRAGLQNRIRLQKSTPDNIEVNESIDFGLAFWMLHEVPNRSHLLGQIATLLKKDGLLLIAEPHFHVSQKDFAQTLGLARSAGLHLQDQPKIFLSYSALLQK